MNVSLTPEHEKLIQDQIQAGRFDCARDVIHEALCLLDEQERLRNLRLEDLRKEIQKGLDSYNRGDYTRHDAASLKAHLEEVKVRGRARLAARDKRAPS